MPLPWKKAKRARITQLVADHLQPPKRGGSLVVETGFPTSLIDLFVKNRDRLKKPSKKKNRLEPETPDPIPSSSFPLSPPMVPPSSSTISLASPLSSRHPNSPLFMSSPCVLASGCSSGGIGNESVGVEDLNQKSGLVVGDENRSEGNGVEVADANRVFVAILKMFLVVVLALGMKKFVVGIMLSAFLLVFMEYVGKHLCRFVKPCEDVQKNLQCLIERFLCLFGIKKHRSIIEEEEEGFKVPIKQEQTTPVVSGPSMLKSNSNSGSSRSIEGWHTMNDPMDEIQIVQPSPYLMPPTREIQSVMYESDRQSNEEKWASEEMAKKMEIMEKEESYTSGGVVDVKSGKNRGKITSRIKKLLNKKLHRSKKKRLQTQNKASNSGGDKDNKVNMGEDKEYVEDGQQHGLEYDDHSSSFSSRGNADQVNFENASCKSSELSREDIKLCVVGENVRGGTERNAWYIIIFVIVLVGLVGGRVLALALTLLWFLLLKSTGILRSCEKGAPGDVSISSVDR